MVGSDLVRSAVLGLSHDGYGTGQVRTGLNVQNVTIAGRLITVDDGIGSRHTQT